MIWLVAFAATIAATWLHTRCKEKTPAELLKNALFSLALLKVAPTDATTDYCDLDGTSLPPAAGASLANACFTYVQDIRDIKRDPWCTTRMLQKQRAIERYVDRNLSSPDAVVAFFDKFVAAAFRES